MDKQAEWLKLGGIGDLSLSECWVGLPKWWSIGSGATRRVVRLDRWLYAVHIGRELPRAYGLVRRPGCAVGCVNPTHAQAERNAVLTQVRQRKLSDDQVRAIRADERPAPAVAADLDISVAHVHAIRQGKRKAAVPDVAPAAHIAEPTKP